MPVAQSFNKILLTTSNNSENNILLQEISGALCVNNAQVIVSDHAAPSLQIESNDALSQTAYSEDSIILEGVSGHLYSNGTNLQSPTFTGLSDTPNSFVSGKYLRVNDAGDALEYVDITGVSSGGGSGGNYEFCTAAISGTQYFSNTNTWINFNGSLSTGSTDLTYFVGGSINANGLRPSADGYYNINAAIKAIHSSTNQAASEMHVLVFRYNIDTGTNSQIGYGTEFWEDGGGYNGPQCQVHIPDVYLTTNHVILIRLYGWRNSTNFSVALETDPKYTYLNLSRADIGGSGSGSTTFTGLSDTPSDFTAGKYLRVNDAGDALEYVDITGVSSGVGGGSATSYIDSVVTKTEAGPIDKRSTDTTASSTNYYRVPVESLRFDDLEVGATYRINVSLLGYHGSNDLGSNLNIYNRASAFSSDINLDVAGITNYNNNGGDSDPAIITMASAGNDTTTYGETHSQTKIFEATGTHLDVLADSISSNSFFRNIIIQLEKITVGTSGAYASNSIIADNLSFSYNLPDALLVPLSRGGGYQERVFSFVGVYKNNATSVSGVWSGGNISYELGLGSERFTLVFDNDTNGTFGTYSESEATTTDVVWSEMSPATTNQPTLKEFIDANRAIYYK